ncbi:replication initiator protein [Sigmofec virus UA08Rod_4043]|uniref:Replication initiator protein n=1 Tax=Sigmofec virus UA08Rod_4043 TaxID=2929393 RepID=A0A976N1J5_9VIRU|nr:replication initiator protein [Sigmofec virus UA08Rod_4043]
MKMTLSIPNNSKYIDFNTSRSHNTFSSPDSFPCQRQKQCGYYVRNYYEYLDCTSKGGAVFFMTFTYNNKALHYLFGHPVIDNRDMLWFLRDSGFRKFLSRRYHNDLKYFLTSEMGEGKGKRGIGRNPHFHVIFYLYPKKGYPVVDARNFLHLCRYYWCGPDYKRLKYKDYRFGTVEPGKNRGLLYSPAAINYVSKYVIKDTTVINHRASLIRSCLNTIRRRLYLSYTVQKIIFCRINGMLYNPDSSYHYMPKMTPAEYLVWLNSHPDALAVFESLVHRCYDTVWKKDINSRYRNKVLLSNGLGASALKDIDPFNPVVNIPCSSSVSGFKSVPIPLYYYRKIYYDVVKNSDGNYMYVTNLKYVDYHASRFSDTFSRDVDTFKCNILLLRNDSLFESFKSLYQLPDYRSLVDSYMSNFSDDFASLYIAYKTIYQYRYCSDFDKPLDYYNDYCDFLIHPYYTGTFYSDGLNDSSCPRPPKTYASHPVFKPYLHIFHYIDCFFDFYHYICAEDSYEKYLRDKELKKKYSLSQIDSKYGKVS